MVVVGVGEVVVNCEFWGIGLGSFLFFGQDALPEFGLELGSRQEGRAEDEHAY